MQVLGGRRLLAAVASRRVAALCALAACVGALLSFLFTSRSARASGQATEMSSTPFTAVVLLKQFGPDGKLAVRSTWNYYRFSDGSFATGSSREIEPERIPLSDNVTDLHLRQDLLLEPITKSVITFKRAPGEQVSALQGMWEENCPSGNVEATEPGELFFGFPTVHITKHFDPTWKEDRWMIRELRCFSVKEVDVSGASRNEHVVTSLALGEPPRTALSAPEGFVERSPAEAAKAYALAKNGDQLFDPRALAKLTKEYVPLVK